MRLRRIGYWRNDQHPEFPDPHDLVDETWSPEERDDVAQYLEGGVPFRFGGGLSHCRICGRPNGAAELTYPWLVDEVRRQQRQLPQPRSATPRV